jgi:hypothetical protein
MSEEESLLESIQNTIIIIRIVSLCRSCNNLLQSSVKKWFLSYGSKSLESSLSPELRRISLKSSSICAFLLIKRLTSYSLRKKMALDMSSLLNILLSPASSATIQVLRQQFACILLTHMILNLRSSFATWSHSFFHGLPEGEWITQIVVLVTISGQSMYIASFQEWACLKFSGPYDLVRLSTKANWSPFTEKAMGESPYLNRSLWCSDESFYNFLQCAHTLVHVAWRMGVSKKPWLKIEDTCSLNIDL